MVKDCDASISEEMCRLALSMRRLVDFNQLKQTISKNALSELLDSILSGTVPTDVKDLDKSELASAYKIVRLDRCRHSALQRFRNRTNKGQAALHPVGRGIVHALFESTV